VRAELSDFSVCTTWGICGKKLYLLGLLRQRLEYPALKRAVREQQKLYHATEVLIEDKASGTQLIQELIADGCHGVERYQPTMDKIMRLHAQTTAIENGFVYIPETAPWLVEYLHEISVFPNGKHDDQVDSTAQFLDWFKTPMPHSGIFEYYRREAERLTPPEPVHVRIKAPPGIGSVQTFSGRHITIGEDRIVEMSEEDFTCLIRGAMAQDDVAMQTPLHLGLSVRIPFAPAGSLQTFGPSRTALPSINSAPPFKCRGGRTSRMTGVSPR